ncbi:MAG: hypothetical protein WBM42_06570 [Eudoraea sp.]|uniref:hypothetical protein n=1 Tax=Eudoraea sp. TaxID=1979955 RepID=UPI003C7876CF
MAAKIGSWQLLTFQIPTEMKAVEEKIEVMTRDMNPNKGTKRISMTLLLEWIGMV